jgi:hypothetical protein
MDELATMVPPPPRTSAGIWCLRPRKRDLTFVSITQVVVRLADVAQRRSRLGLLHAGVVEHGVEASVLVECRLDSQLLRRVLRGVAAHKGRLAAQALDLLNQLVALLLAATSRHHAGAGLGERQRRGVSDAARCAGDQRHLVPKVKRGRHECFVGSCCSCCCCCCCCCCWSGGGLPRLGWLG